MAVKTRTFGRLGWPVGEVGCGMWGMVGWSGADLGEVRRALQRAVDLGGNFFDTAYAYGNGRGERLLGELVRAQENAGRRLFTATKIPPKNRLWPSPATASLDDTYPPDHIEAFLRRSLENLGLPRVDLLQLHTWQDAWIGDPRLHRAVIKLRGEGLFEGFGISLNRWEPWNGVEAVRSGLVDAVQVVYNIFDQNPEDQLLPICASRGVAVIARVPFDEGSLAGGLARDSRWPEGDFRNSYFSPANLAATLDRVAPLRTLVPAGGTLAETALRFILGHDAVSVVIPGMRTVAHVEENLAASAAGPLHQRLQGALRAHRWDRLPPTAAP
jgi:aryl-alcohol dehydrogenase-like predicted oxidoreductase